jgi:hypothetical protein
MALTVAWSLQGTSPTTLGATDYLQFSGTTFDTAITVGAYQGLTSVRSSGGSDSSSGNTPKNSKYIASGTVDIGAGTVNIQSATITSANAPLKILINGAGTITLSAVTFYCYDGTTDATAPTSSDYYAAEVDVDGYAGNDAAWTNCDGSGAALALDEATFLASATDHTAYLLISMSPNAVGIASANKMKISFTYQ